MRFLVSIGDPTSRAHFRLNDLSSCTKMTVMIGMPFTPLGGCDQLRNAAIVSARMLLVPSARFSVMQAFPTFPIVFLLTPFGQFLSHASPILAGVYTNREAGRATGDFNWMLQQGNTRPYIAKAMMHETISLNLMPNSCQCFEIQIRIALSRLIELWISFS
jgi:hypothetical protein